MRGVTPRLGHPRAGSQPGQLREAGTRSRPPPCPSPAVPLSGALGVRAPTSHARGDASVQATHRIRLPGGPAWLLEISFSWSEDAAAAERGRHGGTRRWVRVLVRGDAGGARAPSATRAPSKEPAARTGHRVGQRRDPGFPEPGGDASARWEPLAPWCRVGAAAGDRGGHDATCSATRAAPSSRNDPEDDGRCDFLFV